MLKYFFNSLFILLVTNAIGQQKELDSITAKPQRFGIRVGLDLSKIARSFYEKDYRGVEFVGDYKLTKKMYLAAEIGNENKTTTERILSFATKGSYFKVGFDANFYENWLDMENMIHVGLRYGVSTFSHTIDNYQVYNTSTFFPMPPKINNGEELKGLSAHWAEVVAGFKVALFKNLYAGVSLRLNYLMAEKKPDNFDNLYVPGYNRTYDGKFGAGWNYTMSYFIPLYKSKSKKIPVPKK